MKFVVGWMVLIGALLMLVAAFLPALRPVEVGTATAEVESLIGMAVKPGGWFVVAVPIGAALVLALGAVVEWGKVRGVRGRIGQAFGLALSLLGAAAVQSAMAGGVRMQYHPSPGALLLLFGMALAGVGLMLSILPSIRAEPLGPPTTGPRLEVLRGEMSSPLPVEQDGLTIGRSRRNQLVLDELIVSALHARIRAAQGEWFIQDQGSENGTFVNNKPVKAQRLTDGDQIRIGSTVLVFRNLPAIHRIRNSR